MRTNEPDAWTRLAATELKDKGPQELVWHTPEGIDVNPLYTAADLEGIEALGSIPGIPPFLRGPASMGPLRIRLAAFLPAILLLGLLAALVAWRVARWARGSFDRVAISREVDASAAGDFENAAAPALVKGNELHEMMQLFEMVLVEICEESARTDRMRRDVEIVDVSLPVLADLRGRRHANHYNSAFQLSAVSSRSSAKPPSAES